MVRFHCLFVFLFLVVTYAASDMLHESCNRTRYPAFCVKFLRSRPNRNQHSLVLYSLHKSIVTGIATVRYANNYIENGHKHGWPKGIEETRLFDCLTACADALNISVSVVKRAKAELDVDPKNVTATIWEATQFVLGAGCASRRGLVLDWIDENDKKYKKLLRITLDLIRLLKK